MNVIEKVNYIKEYVGDFKRSEIVPCDEALVGDNYDQLYNFITQVYINNISYDNMILVCMDDLTNYIFSLREDPDSLNDLFEDEEDKIKYCDDLIDSIFRSQLKAITI